MLLLGYEYLFKYTPILYNHIRGGLRNYVIYIIEMCSALKTTNLLVFWWYSVQSRGHANLSKGVLDPITYPKVFNG